MTILGISIGPSRIGVCILQNGAVLERQIHSFPTSRSDTKLRLILARYRKYLHTYQVDAVIVKVPPRQHYTNSLLRLIRRIEALSKEYYCEFDLISKREIKHRLSLCSTTEMILYAVQLYPELTALYKKGIATNHAYHKKLFEAVLSAHTCQLRLEARKAVKGLAE